MPNYSLLDNPFDQFVNRDFSPAPTSPITPPFVDPTMYKLEDDGEYADLEARLKRVLAASRPRTKRGAVGNVLRAGLTAASMPNRAYGGPMDTLAAIAGGMNLHQDQELGQEKRFENEQNRQARSLQGMLRERRERAVANARMASEESQAAYHRSRMNAPDKLTDPYSFLTLGNNSMVRANKRDGTYQFVTDPNAKKATKSQEIVEEAKAIGEAVRAVNKQFEAKEINEKSYRALIKKLTGYEIKDEGEPTSQFVADREQAQAELVDEGVDPTPENLNSRMDKIRLAREKTKRKVLGIGSGTGTGAGRSLPQWKTKNNALTGIEEAFKAANPDAKRGSTPQQIKGYYAAMLGWLGNNAEVQASIPREIRASVLSELEAKATRKAVQGIGIEAFPGVGKTPSTPASPRNANANTITTGTVVNGMRFTGTKQEHLKDKKYWIPVDVPKVPRGTF